MAGRRLLDAAIVANVTRNVAKHHFAIRSQQFDRWNKTSSLAKAVKDQTDRVTLTVQAANALIQRLNETGPPFSSSNSSSPAPSSSSSKPPDESGAPRKSNVQAQETDQPTPQGLNQDHHYKRPLRNNISDIPREGDLSIKQGSADRSPFPDGSIPPSDAPISQAPNTGINSDSNSTRPSVAPRKESLESDQKPQTARVQTSPISPSFIGGSQEQSQESHEIPKQAAIPEQDELPDGINTDVFHSPRVARKLGGRTFDGHRKDKMDVRRAADTPLEQSELAQGKDQDSFNVRGPSTASSSSPSDTVLQATTPSRSQGSSAKPSSSDDGIHDLAADIAKDVSAAELPPQSSESSVETNSSSSVQMHESRVPSTRFGRLAQYGGLATSMIFGAVGETFRRATGLGNSDGGSLMLSASNMERLVAKLSRMRGAALKLGQMMSFQDSKMLPPPIHDVLQRVQDHADYMPSSQRNEVLASNFGSGWRDLFSSFNEVPIAAASIGQVHRATLASNNTPVAVKIQYPGVAQSISSDLSNLSILLTASRLLPRGLYLDKTIANARSELAWECDYEREAAAQTRFQQLLSDESDTFTVPTVIQEASGPQVLTAELMPGTAVTKSTLNLSQEERDWIGTHILRLCLRELTEFKFMQTDPNWTNFLYNRSTHKLELLDFGAARDFPSKFVDPYVRILIAASRGDHSTIRDLSIELGYLTGEESKTMLDAHIASVMTLAEPFGEDAPEDAAYDFSDQTITDRVREQIPVMLRERLAPPPEETYSLHRKLSGAFLLLARLGSRVRCREMFARAIEKWEDGRKGE